MTLEHASNWSDDPSRFVVNTSDPRRRANANRGSDHKENGPPHG